MLSSLRQGFRYGRWGIVCKDPNGNFAFGYPAKAIRLCRHDSQGHCHVKNTPIQAHSITRVAIQPITLR
jgi:hypothetical protein